MKIAVVSPSPVPFTIGGAENLAWGLCESINKYTTNQAELIKLPVKEFEFWDLIDSYYSFYKLDLSHFDMVISTKYPSWMVKHDNSVVYMLHTLRGLYDTYELIGFNEQVPEGCDPIDDMLFFMQNNAYPEALDVFFEKLYALKSVDSIPSHYFSFPGPFIRKCVHYMDSCALRGAGVKKLCAISNNVASRRDYFPENSYVNVIYPPTTKQNTSEGPYEHLFMISRLDSPKRIDMLIRAMKYVKSDIPLYIAGTGPEREKLEALAKGDSRIHFLGYISDEDAIHYYSHALCIPYFPYDEDYGYITIEAMLHKKPVITTTDAGGTNEFVRDGENGFIVPFDEEYIARCIDCLAADRSLAERMGRAAYETVKDISWDKAVDELLSEEVTHEKTKKKLVLVNTFEVYPPRGGGQARIYNIYKDLYREYDVTVISFATIENKKRNAVISEHGMREISIPRTLEHEYEEREIFSKVGQTVTDIAMKRLSHLTGEYHESLEKAACDADLIVLSHPYLYHEVVALGLDVPVIYDAHNAEYLMKKQFMPEGGMTAELLNDLYYQEKTLCEDSILIMTCSEADRENISRLYGINKDKFIVIPNGVDCSDTPYISPETRIKNKHDAGLENEKICIFMGSWHIPNLEAGDAVVELAKKCPDVKFMIMGTMSAYFNDRQIPQNLGILGLVSEDEKKRIFSLCDMALNPMLSGSGTNLKMFDYMASGIPVLSTPFGTRGIEDKSVCMIADIDKMPEVISSFDLNKCSSMVEHARKYTEEKFDWHVISEKLSDRLAKI